MDDYSETIPSTPEASDEQIDRISDLLMGKKKEAAPEPDTGSPDEPKAAEAVPEESDEDKAAKTKVDYRMKVAVPMPAGEEALTVGQLKDYYLQNKPNEIERMDRENKTMRDLAELREMAEVLQVLPQEKIQEYHQRKQQALATEQAALLQVLPAWKDETSFNAARSAIGKTIDEYQLPMRVSSPTDSHQWVKLLNDFTVLRDKIKSAQVNVKPAGNSEPAGKPRSHVGTVSNLDALKQRAKQSGTERDKTAAIQALLTRH